jgi:hypothetical protein
MPGDGWVWPDPCLGGRVYLQLQHLGQWLPYTLTGTLTPVLTESTGQKLLCEAALSSSRTLATTLLTPITLWCAAETSHTLCIEMLTPQRCVMGVACRC